MTVWLICSAEGPMPEGALTGEEYRAARREAMKAAAVPEGEKPLHGGGRRICISGAPCARISAEALCPGAEYAVRAELDEVFRFLNEWRFVVYGLLLVLMMRFRPQGALGWQSTLPYHFSKRALKLMENDGEAAREGGAEA